MLRLVSSLLTIVAVGFLVLTGAFGGNAASLIAPTPSSPGPISPCSGIFAEPPFEGVSPLALAIAPEAGCNFGYGDLGVWQVGGHSYVAVSGLGKRLFYIFNVDNPYSPSLLITQPLPPETRASTSVFPFRHGNSRYLAVGAGSASGSPGPGCGLFIYNVTDPANPSLVTQQRGSDWCNVHEHFISTDSAGNADYAWLAMGRERGSGYKVVVLDIRDLTQVRESGRYERPDSNDDNYVHDVTVIGERVYLAHWAGGLIVHDKATLAHNTNPAPLHPLDAIRPAGFQVHHAWPSTDGKHVFIEDELNNSPTAEKIKVYDISDLSNPRYETGIVGEGIAAGNHAHNLKVLSRGPGRDLLLVGWYQAGMRGFEVDMTGSIPAIRQTISHQLKAAPQGRLGNAWGVEYLPCTVKGKQTTCLFTSDIDYGLVVDALGLDPSLDPYSPTSEIGGFSRVSTSGSCVHTVWGSARDYYSVVAQVEISSDGGATWARAQGTGSWSYNWTIPRNGTYTLRSRARDVAGNVEENPVSLTTSAVSCVLTNTGQSPRATGTPPTPVPTAQIPGSGSATFPETGKSATGIFLEYWNRNGGLSQQGFPISNLVGEVSELDRKPYTVQYFERAVFEYHPENQAPFNVLLSQLGTFQYKKKYPDSAPNQKPNTSPGSVYFRETNKRLGGRFLQYWQANGGLMQQGYPISDEFTEVSDLNGKEYAVQYFERAVFEYHPENQPPYDVLLSQLGTFRYREKYSR